MTLTVAPIAVAESTRRPFTTGSPKGTDTSRGASTVEDDGRSGAAKQRTSNGFLDVGAGTAWQILDLNQGMPTRLIPTATIPTWELEPG